MDAWACVLAGSISMPAGFPHTHWRLDTQALSQSYVTGRLKENFEGLLVRVICIIPVIIGHVETIFGYTAPEFIPMSNLVSKRLKNDGK